MPLCEKVYKCVRVLFRVRVLSSTTARTIKWVVVLRQPLSYTPHGAQLEVHSDAALRLFGGRSC